MNTTGGRILPGLADAIAALRHAPEWGGVLVFNEFRIRDGRAEADAMGRRFARGMDDREDRLAAAWLPRQGILVSVDVAGQAVQTAARDHPFHPVKAYLRRLHWDGVERLPDDSGISRSRWPAVVAEMRGKETETPGILSKETTRCTFDE